MCDHNITRLQRIQNFAASIICNARSRSSATALLHDLRWLRIMERIDYKIALTTFKILTTHQPAYLNSLLTENVPKRVLRSSTSGLTLSVHVVKSVHSSRVFSSYAPRLWNGFSRKIRDCCCFTE